MPEKGTGAHVNKVAVCRWPGCEREAKSRIGTTLLGTHQLCVLHRSTWLELSYPEQVAMVERLQPYRTVTWGGMASYARMGPKDCIGVRGRGGNVNG